MMDIAAKYNRNTFIDFLANSFLPQDFQQEIENIVIDKVGSKIKRAEKLGFCTSLDLSVYEFEHESLNDPRVTLSRESFKIIEANDTASNALAIFYSGAANWRLSLITSGYSIGKTNKQVKRDFSNPRRYSYLLGEGCKKHTPEGALFTKGRVSTIEDLFSRFAIDVLTEKFYRELFAWYDTRAVDIVRFPAGSGKNARLPKTLDEQAKRENRRHLIRLITRLIFVWFLKQKDHLIPEWLFDKTEAAGVLRDFDPASKTSGNYYNGIIQNLFFATLNKGITERAFAEEGTAHYGIKTYYRDHKDNPLFNIPHTEFIKKLESVPFLNGGLFECLDKRIAGEEQEYHDGFSQESGRAAFIPNCLFWGDGGGAEGILELFSRYNFTVEENTPQDIEIALDPELLGKVFENLLGTFNEETRSTARNESGSFYTPREIVDYMADVSLKEYFKGKLTSSNEPDETELGKKLDKLFSYHETEHDFDTEQVKLLIEAVNTCKILDPACGSGAFPMGILHKLTFILGKLDPENKLWKEKQFEKADSLDDPAIREKVKGDIEEAFKNNELGYGRKLYLIENCIYGVDIQPIAIQISKLRFFISLIVDQKTGGVKEDNYRVLPLPNLETKFVAANTLLGIKREESGLADPDIEKLQHKLLAIRHKHFSARNAKEKMNLRKEDAKLSKELSDLLKKDGFYNSSDAAQMAAWNPYDQNASSPFFDSYWIFGVEKGFDVVIGNPPYVSAPNMVGTNPELRQTIINAKRYTTLYQKWDLYIPFMELGIQLLAQCGQFTMIVPYPLTNQTYAKKLREFIVSQCRLIEIVDLNGTKVFENATVSNCIPFISKSPPGSNCFISHINEYKEIKRIFCQPLSDLVQDGKTAVWNLTRENRKTDRHQGMNILGDFCYISVGMVLNADEKTAKGEFSKGDLISEMLDKIHCRKYIEAKDIERYRVKKIHYLEYNTKRCPDKLRRPTFRELYEKPKLMFNCLGDLITILDDNTKFLHNHSIFSAVLWKDLKGINNKSITASVTRYSRFSRREMEALSKQVDLRYFLGALNSKYASVLLSNLRGGDYHIYPEHLRNLPVPLVSVSEQQPIISLVDKILAAKAADPKADTRELEQRIDRLVYRLYNLSWDEVRMIEPGFSMSKAEYEGMEG